MCSDSPEAQVIYGRCPDVLSLDSVAAIDADLKRVNHKLEGHATASKRERLLARRDALAFRREYLLDEAHERKCERRRRRLGYLDNFTTIETVADALQRENDTLAGQTLVGGFEAAYPGEIDLTRDAIALLASRLRSLVAAEADRLVARRSHFLIAALGEFPDVGGSRDRVWLNTAVEITTWRLLEQAAGVDLDPLDVGPFEDRAAWVRDLIAEGEGTITLGHIQRASVTAPQLSLVA